MEVKGSCESSHSEDSKLNGVSETSEKPPELQQSGVVESVICAGIIYHLNSRKMPTEYNKLCSLFKEVEWNRLLEWEWEAILRRAERIYAAHRKRHRHTPTGDSTV